MYLLHIVVCIYKKLFPSLGKTERGEKGYWRVYCFPRVPYGHPRLSMIRRLRRRLTTYQLIT